VRATVLHGPALLRHSPHCKAINLSHKSEHWDCTDVFGAPIPRGSSRSFYVGSHAVLVQPVTPPPPPRVLRGHRPLHFRPRHRDQGPIKPRGKSGQLHHRRADLPGNFQSRWGRCWWLKGKVKYKAVCCETELQF
jgi:hypothetical protein